MAVALALLACGCNRGHDQAVRRAWERAVEHPDADDAIGPRDRGGTPTGGGATTDDQATKAGWERLDAMLEIAARVLARGADDDTLIRLATRWCEVEPTPQAAHGDKVWVCNPEPALWVSGHALTLELARSGVVGLVARDLSGAQSERLLRRVLEHGAKWCSDAWRALGGTEPGGAHLHDCRAALGPRIVAGRYPRDPQADLWQVSVAVLSAS